VKRLSYEEYRRLKENHNDPECTMPMQKGGEGSGFFGHPGRPGMVGGSAPEGGEPERKMHKSKALVGLSGKPSKPFMAAAVSTAVNNQSAYIWTMWSLCPVAVCTRRTISYQPAQSAT
jgi:hypothetical protein